MFMYHRRSSLVFLLSSFQPAFGLVSRPLTSWILVLVAYNCIFLSLHVLNLAQS